MHEVDRHRLFAFDNSYARLPDRFFPRLPPTPVAAPRLVWLNENQRLLTVLSRPYEDQPDFGRYANPPRPDQVVRQTICGT
jgi:uncharacterized protein YdiU (UPF0061 family)